MTLPLGPNKLFYLNNGKGPIAGSRNPSSKSLDIKLRRLKTAQGLILSTTVKLQIRVHSEIFNSLLQFIKKKGLGPVVSTLLFYILPFLLFQ